MKKHLKALLFLLYAALVILLLVSLKDFTPEKLINYSPENSILAAAFLLFLYAVKSISIFFPVAVLQIAGGYLFPLPFAIAINCVGSLIEFTVPYFIGRFSGSKAIEEKVMKNKRAREIIVNQSRHKFFICFFLRVISCLPCDLVSMYFGAVRIPYSVFLTASLLGTLPGIVPITYMGKNVTNPTSPQFMFSILITIGAALLSVLLYKLYSIKKKKEM